MKYPRRLTDRKSTRLNSSHTVIYTLSLHDALPIFVLLSALRKFCTNWLSPGARGVEGVAESDEVSEAADGLGVKVWVDAGFTTESVIVGVLDSDVDTRPQITPCLSEGTDVWRKSRKRFHARCQRGLLLIAIHKKTARA